MSMFAHKVEDFDDTVTPPNNTMEFNQAVFGQAVPRTTDIKCPATRLVSVPYDEPQPQQQAAAADNAPHLVSACTSSEESSCITGKYTNIESKYQIDPRVIGSGHHGSVRECIDRNTGQRYAVKSIRKSDPTVKPGGLAREIMLLQEMKHDNIIQLVDMYEDEDYVHLVTDLCKGGELFDKIVEKSECDNGAPCFTEEEAARIMYQILKAVSYMHKNGVAHRDIKPENILFETADVDSAVKIIDFGLSRKHYGGVGEKSMTTVVGTPYYIAPEVLRRKYDKSCDLWSIGTICYILLCGYPPFNGANNDQTHKSVLKGRYYFPAEDWKDTSREAMDFIYRLLQMDPRRRMTAEQALNHPWIVKHVTKIVEMNKEYRQDNSSVEVVYKDSPPPPPRKHSVAVRGGQSPPRRKVRLSMFAL